MPGECKPQDWRPDQNHMQQRREHTLIDSEKQNIVQKSTISIYLSIRFVNRDDSNKPSSSWVCFVKEEHLFAFWNVWRTQTRIVTGIVRCWATIAHKDHHIYVKRPCCYSNTGLLVLILIAPHENEQVITTWWFASTHLGQTYVQIISN
jgi:hypothetical protein